MNYFNKLDIEDNIQSLIGKKIKVCCPYCGADQIHTISQYPSRRVYVICWKCDVGYYNWVDEKYRKKYGKNV